MTDSDPGATFPTDGVRLEAVVDGRVAPEDLTASEQRLLDLASAARSSASTKELAGLGDALIVFATQHSDEAEPGATWSRSRRTLGRMRSAGAVAAVVVVLSAGAAAAATTGELPTRLQHIAHPAMGHRQCPLQVRVAGVPLGQTPADRQILPIVSLSLRQLALLLEYISDSAMGHC